MGKPMNAIRFGVVTSAAMLLASTDMASAGGHKFINFDVPGAAATFPLDISDNNDVTGDYKDPSNIDHGFIRTSNGTITTVDVPGASSTEGAGINGNGEVVGTYYDSSSVSHGFVRAPDGTITTFDPQGSTGTFAYGINGKGQVTGGFFDSNGLAHGYLRKASGKFIVFDPENSVLTFGQAINYGGAVAGEYCTNFLCDPYTGFVRSADGTITSFSVANAKMIVPVGIDPQGTIGGQYYTYDGGRAGFLRTPDGQIVTFGACAWITGMNRSDWLVGFNTDFFGNNHGCLRAPDGTITAFDDPDAGSDNGEGTQPSAVNRTRYVTGYYADSNHVYHGFIVHRRK